MDLKTLISSGGGLLILSVLIQIAPIKINPWGWLFNLVSSSFLRFWKSVGSAINGDVVAELGEINKRLTVLEEHEKIDDDRRAEEKALDARRRILRFSDEIRSGVRHSKEHFDNILEDIDYYETYCKEHTDFRNNRVKISIKIIKQTYERCTKENTFL